ncbi:hypothetical protein SAMN05216436_120106 [bacterium A37T11]|nr:hypothetical protein SAMN05216436_120106 [bacterium A37T11]
MIRIIVLFLLVYISLPAKAQLKIYSPIQAYFDDFPASSVDPQGAYSMYYPKPKTSIHDQYQQLLKDHLSEMAGKVGTRSGILNMMAGNFVDNYRVNAVKDKQIDAAFHLTEAQVKVLLDDLYKESSAPFLQKLPRMTEYDHVLLKYDHAKKTFNTWFPKVKAALLNLDDAFSKNGFDLALKDSTHPYYVQALEIKGYMLYKIKEIHHYIASNDEVVANILERARKSPASVKSKY